MDVRDGRSWAQRGLVQIARRTCDWCAWPAAVR